MLLEEVRKFDASARIEEAWTPPSSWYIAPEFHRLEQSAVFQRSWQLVARREQLTEVGAYVSGCTAGEPWVVVRAEDGLRAFSNVCRHKGREVVTGNGVGPELVCGYHAWSYRHDGTLSSAPRMAGIEGFDRKAMSLPAMAVTAWGPWVFVNVDPDAAPFIDGIGELDRRLEASNWGDLVFRSSTSWTVEANWKVVADNYLDGGYHIPHMHPSLDGQLDMQTYGTEVFDTCSIQSSGPSTDDHERIGGRALYAWIYPNLMLNRYGPCLDTNHVVPLAENRCRVDYEFYFAPDVDDEFIEKSIAQAAVTQREDIEICESVQRGLMSSRYEAGRYAPRVEVGELHFHQLLAADYERGLQNIASKTR